ncbi:DUF3575 domain-containing protein [Mangrovimonas sp. TPBH4]|uniref:DUF3575 domain-containing protein n=1 Tax=Mangrovimonas sp. TPBH4 TaxID=1645914 RepID=UPI0006B469F2|nr:DUF3575 domain-containing protein [Mangrovimonas sp. TPBH4]
MKKIICSAIVLLIASTSLFAQSESQNEFRNKYVTFNMISFIYSNTPRWNFGYYHNINNHFTLGTEAGIGTHMTTKDYFSLEFSPEIRYILNPKGSTKKFISLEGFYIYHKEEITDYTYQSETDSNEYHYDSASYKRHKYGMNLNYGMIVNFSKRTGIIPKVGLGIKMRNVVFSNIVNPTPYEDDNEGFIPSIRNYRKVEGYHSSVNFNFELQFFYKFQ